MSGKKSNSLSITFLYTAIVPMIVLTLIFLIAGSASATRTVVDEASERMSELSKTLLSVMDVLYPGDYYALEEGGEIYFGKGDHLFNSDFSLIDEIKATTGNDISIDYQSYAVITTFCDSNGERLIGAGENQRVVKDVIDSGQPKFYTNVVLESENYFAYYTPLFDGEGQVIGMLSVAEPSQHVREAVKKTLAPVLVISLLVCILLCIITYRKSKSTVSAILKVQKYMKSIAAGNFSAELDPSVSKRTDEIGDMGLSAVSMASSLRKKVEEDQLTGLCNRRSAHRFITNTISSYIDKGTGFCLALGDIDFFKKVNDTYGHDAGDLVLIAVSKTLKQNMMGKGYAIRWGGEEFILVFENTEIKAAINYMNDIMDEVRSLEIVSGEHVISVNMTFGLMECEDTDKKHTFEKNEKGMKDKNEFITRRMDYYINSADKKLYYGKEHGRNQLVF